MSTLSVGRKLLTRLDGTRRVQLRYWSGNVYDTSYVTECISIRPDAECYYLRTGLTCKVDEGYVAHVIPAGKTLGSELQLLPQHDILDPVANEITVKVKPIKSFDEAVVVEDFEVIAALEIRPLPEKMHCIPDYGDAV